MARALALERDRIAQTLAEGAEIPNPAIGIAVVMAGRAAHVVVERKTVVRGVVEMLLSEEHLRRECLGRHDVDRQHRIRRGQVGLEHLRQIEARDRSVHEIVDVGATAVCREGHALGRATRREPHQLKAVLGVVDSELATRFERHEEVAVVAGEGGAGRDAGIVEIDPEAGILELGREGDAGRIGPHRRLEGHARDAAERAGADVVLLRRHVGVLTAEIQHRRTDVVRHAGALALGLGAPVVGERDRRGEGQRAR